VQNANERQKSVLASKIRRRFGADLSKHRFAVWGLAFKPNTDDMREAPSLVVIDSLLDQGARVVAYDPVAVDEAREIYKSRPEVEFAKSASAAVKGADALVIVTEWKAFRSPDFEELKREMKAPVIFDGRNLYDPRRTAALGFDYFGIGVRGPAPSEGTGERG